MATVTDITGEDRVRSRTRATASWKHCPNCADRDLATSFPEPEVNGQGAGTTSPTNGSPPSTPTTTASRAIGVNNSDASEAIERTFAYLCETGGSRRATVREMTKVTA